jgi:adenylate cyclase
VIARNSSFSYRGTSPDIRVVAQELGVRYVVEGSVRKAGERVRITAQLIEAETGNHLWAERFDRELKDIFAVQDEITQRIVGALQPEIGTAEWERARRKSPDSLDAWAIYHQGIHHLYRYSKADNAEARRLFRQAIEQDNQFASAHAMLGRVLSMRHEHDLAIAEWDKAIELNPNMAQAQFGRGLALVLSGQPDDAIVNLENAARLSPRDPNYYAFLVILAWANLLQGRYDGALEWARRAAAQPNSGVWGNATLAIVLAHLDRCEEARKALDEPIEEKPDFALSFIEETLPFQRESDRFIFEDGLRRSGLTT